MTKRVILVSGGIDSTIAVYHYKKLGGENIPVFIDYGQPYKDKEIKAVKKLFGNELKILNFENKIDEDAQNPFIPNRNLTFASLIATIYYPDEIVMGGLKDDVVEDKNPQAFKEMSDIISKFSRKRIEVVSPFWEKTKGEIIADYLNLEYGPTEVLYDAVSCYAGGEGHCGDCPACFRRYVAFKTNGLEPGNISKRITIEYLKKIHNYDKERQVRTFRAVQHLFKDLLAYDIDGVLTNETEGYNYAERTVNKEIANKVNNDYENGHLVVLYTSRFESDRTITEKWLEDNGIKYHSLIMNKLPYDRLLDDKAYNYQKGQ